MATIEINGRTYQEADRGRFDASLIDNGSEIAYTYGERVIMVSGRAEDVKAWAESYLNVALEYFRKHSFHEENKV